ncbi:hypothetical protein HZS_573, partial [Henneguya salminicola]
MSEFHRFKELKIVKHLKFYEKFLINFMNVIGHSVGHLTLLHRITFHGLSVSRKANRTQTHMYDENGTKVYRRLEAKDGLLVDFKGVNSVKEIFRQCVEAYKNRPCMGERKILNISNIEKNPKKDVHYILSDFVWSTYSQVLDQVLQLSRNLKKLNLNQENKIALFAETCKNWMVMALSAMEIRAAFVTLYTTLSDACIVFCLTLTEPTVIYVDHKTIDRIVILLPQLPSIKTIIFDTNRCSSNEYILEKQINGVNVLRFNDLTKYSDTMTKNDKFIQYEYHPNDTVLIMFTSGSSGIPKGVVITNQNIVSIMGGVCHRKEFWSARTYPAYLPLSHILEFTAELAVLSFGGKVGYCQPLTLLSTSPGLGKGCKGDLEILKPSTIFTLVLERIKNAVMEKIGKQLRLIQILFQVFYNMRAYYYSRGYDTPIINRIFFQKFRNLFGGKLEYGMIGGSLVSCGTEEFINICFGSFKQAYGTTELCCGGTFSEIDYFRPNNIGPPIGCSEIKLISWEEGTYILSYNLAGYFSNDPKNPRGEIAVHGLNVSPGYYKNPEATNEFFITDSLTGKLWFYTGDIAELLPDGTFRIIDRKKDIVKLTHGEYISLAKIENIVLNCKFVEMCCVCPNKNHSHLVALIILNKKNVTTRSTQFGMKEDEEFEQMIKNIKVESFIKGEILEEFKKFKLNKFEFVKTIHIVQDIWTPESGL